jgi:hypothetical protein
MLYSFNIYHGDTESTEFHGDYSFGKFTTETLRARSFTEIKI